MAGKTNLTFTNFSAKKLLSKAHTSHAATDNEEIIGSAVQISAQTIFADTVPQSPSKTLNTVQNSAVEYVEFDLNPIAASYFDANSYDSDATAQPAGHHAYYFSLKSSYETDSDNSKAGSGGFENGQHLTGTLGGVQIIPPAFSLDAPNPYQCTIYSGADDVSDQISLTDEIDWYVDYYNGILYVQDYDSGKVPIRAKAFIYVGDMLSTQVGSGASTAEDIGWLGSAAGAISTTGSLFIGTSNAVASDSDIFFGSTGEARFNVQQGASDFSVFSQNKTGIKVDADQDQVLILSGGAATSPDESSFTDVGFFVSGSAGAKDSNSRGVSLFGGDVVISGTLYDGSGNLIAGSGGGTVTSGSFNVPQPDEFVTTASLSLAGGLGFEYTSDTQGNDTFFFVSGSIGSRGTGTGGTSVFGGDLLVSGTVYGNNISSTSNSDINILPDGSGKVNIDGNGSTSGVIVSDGLIEMRTGNGNPSKIELYCEVNNAHKVTLAAPPHGQYSGNVNFQLPPSNGSTGQFLKTDGSGNTTWDNPPEGVNFSGGDGEDNQMITADGSGNIVAESNITFNGSQLVVTGSILPGSDKEYDLGGPKNRFANIYTGDLHLRNERGHWQIIEEADDLTVVNRLTGKKYKFALIPYEEKE